MRYLRQEGLVDQVKLKETCVLVAGLGGLGNPVATYLTLMGVGTIYLLDDDVVEESNLNRQFLFTKKDIGKPKTEVSKKRLSELNENVKLITTSELMDTLKVDLIMDCFDNWPSRFELWDFAFEGGVPVISGAADETMGQIAVLFKKDDATPFVNKTENSCMVLGPTVGLIGSKMVLEALKIIKGEKTSKLIVYNKKFEEFPIKHLKGRKIPKERDFSDYKLIRLWNDPIKMKKGIKYLIVCKGGLKSARVAEEAKIKGFEAESMSYRSAKKRGLI